MYSLFVLSTAGMAGSIMSNRATPNPHISDLTLVTWNAFLYKRKVALYSELLNLQLPWQYASSSYCKQSQTRGRKGLEVRQEIVNYWSVTHHCAGSSLIPRLVGGTWERGLGMRPADHTPIFIIALGVIWVTCIMLCILTNRSWAHLHLHPAVSLGWTVHRHTPGGRWKEQDSDRRQ